MDHKGYKMDRKGQKVNFLDQNYLFGGIFLIGIGGTPPPTVPQEGVIFVKF